MVTWNSDADARLLLAILAEIPIKVDYKRVADRFGQGATPRAIVEHLGKLKAKAAATLSSDVGGDSTFPPAVKGEPSTPRKRRGQKVLEGGVSKMQRGRKVKVEPKVEEWMENGGEEEGGGGA